MACRSENVIQNGRGDASQEELKWLDKRCLSEDLWLKVILGRGTPVHQAQTFQEPPGGPPGDKPMASNRSLHLFPV